MLDRYTIVKDARVRQIWNWMHCLSPQQVSDELYAAGFSLSDVFGDLTGTPYDPSSWTFAVVAQRD